MKVRIYEADGSVADECQLAEFFEANDLDEDEREQIEHALYHFGAYNGGGGAAPEWRLVALSLQAGEI